VLPGNISPLPNERRVTINEKLLARDTEEREVFAPTAS
jgi:hypothetical protein